MILKSSLSERAGPAAYITPNNYLVKQVLDEAVDLGIQTTEDVNSSGFLNGDSILVANIDKLINGRSQFGVGATGVKIPLGSIIIDDAHACLDAVEDQFSLDVPMSNPAYVELRALFAEELKKYSYVNWVELTRGDHLSQMQVPFWAWQEKIQDVIEIFHKHRETEALRFSWQILKGVIKQCTCIFGGLSLQVKPRCLPIDQIPSFSGAKRRIYMTATLADDSVLISHLNANIASVSDPIRVKGAGEIGDRMIIAPQEVNPDATDEEVRDLAADIAKTLNVVVLVPSYNRAKFWSGVAQQTLNKDNIAAGVALLKQKHVGLTVLINKYDGVDLPQDACRLLVVDGLPEVSALFQRSEETVMEGTQLQLLRQIQRIEQGMGRGVRSGEDRCAVLLLGARLTQRVNMREARQMFTAATLAQIDMGKEITRQIKGQPVANLRPFLDLCMLRNTADGHAWWQAGRKRLATTGEGTASRVDKAIPYIRKAFDLGVLEQWNAAAEALQPAVNNENEAVLKGYLKQQLAEYVNHFDPVAAQKLLLSGISDNSKILRPIAGVLYSKVPTPAVNQAEAIENFIRSRFIETAEFVLYVKALLSDLQWDSERTDQFEAAMLQLGFLLGFGSQRPDKIYKDGGPDNLWSVGALKYYVIECKSGVEAMDKLVSKDYCNQLLGANSWFAQHYDATCVTVPILVHPLAKFGHEASPSADMRVIDSVRLLELKRTIESFAKAIVSGSGGFVSVAEIAQLINHYHLRDPLFINKFTTHPV